MQELLLLNNSKWSFCRVSVELVEPRNWLF